MTSQELQEIITIIRDTKYETISQIEEIAMFPPSQDDIIRVLENFIELLEESIMEWHDKETEDGNH